MGTIVNDRDKEARNAAYDEYDSEYHSDDNYGLEVDCFRDGVKWADRNPSDKTINQILDWAMAANMHIRKKFSTEELSKMSLGDIRKIQIDYIKEHWEND